MSSNETETNLKADHGQHSDKQAGKRGLLLRFIIFMAQVVAIGLLISLVAGQQNEPKIFVIKVGS
ncbi:hypothetical protein [Psychrobacter sp. DD43]|uniref:hypothetical protein n=1 Tax=Psychrobacter sp. DD43 TaxID=2774128 RepID=UPI00191951AC|nr:hypothetical protein [Psychrobacter sp. DD43]